MSEQNMPMAFGALLTGALLLRKGLAAVAASFAGSGSSGGQVTSVDSTGSALAPGLNADQIIAAVTSRANLIDAAHLPYLLGGGHAGKVNLSQLVPLDCSGAVAAVLGINPRVSSQFERFGSPGAAPGGQGITIYANANHVLMEVDGRFFGTSRSNPAGGAGWIDASDISPAYLAGFTARHLARADH